MTYFNQICYALEVFDTYFPHKEKQKDFSRNLIHFLQLTEPFLDMTILNAFKLNLITSKERSDKDSRNLDSTINPSKRRAKTFLPLFSFHFHCTGQEYVSQAFLCDGVPDCAFGKDEENCSCSTVVNQRMSHCSKLCKNNICHCNSLYYDSGGICSTYTHIFGTFSSGMKPLLSNIENKSSVTKSIQGNIEVNSFMCNDTSTIENKYAEDLAPDCTGGVDELLLRDLFQNLNSSQLCAKISMFPCLPGHTKCFYLNQLCIYALDTNGILQSCRNGAHLGQCKSFQCPNYYKCPGQYCIPNDHVCDGNWNCPKGHEENNCIQRNCRNLFRCRKSKQCLHPTEVCNELKECPLGDDETLCVLSPCPLGCYCLARALECYNLDTHKMTRGVNIGHYVFVLITHCQIDAQAFFVQNCQFLNVSSNRLGYTDIETILTEITFADQLLMLDLGSNNLKTIKRGLLKFSSLHSVFLKNTSLVQVDHLSFESLNNVVVLDLSQNHLSYFTRSLFYGLNKVKLVLLLNNKFTQVGGKVSAITMHLIVSNLGICCYFSKSNCHTLSTDESFLAITQLARTRSFNISNMHKINTVAADCGGLLLRFVPKEIVFVILILIYVLNIMGGICLKQTANTQGLFGAQTSKKSSYFVTRGVIVSNLILSVYVTSITSVDGYYGEEFPLVQSHWKNSFFCFFIAMLLCVHVQSSVIMSFVVALSRTMIVVDPFHTEFKREIYVKKLVLQIYSFSVIFAIGNLSLFLITENNISSLSPACFLVSIPNKAISLKIFLGIAGFLQATCAAVAPKLYHTFGSEVAKSASTVQSQQRLDQTFILIRKIFVEACLEVSIRTSLAVAYFAMIHDNVMLVFVSPWVVIFVSCWKAFTDPFCLVFGGELFGVLRKRLRVLKRQW